MSTTLKQLQALVLQKPPSLHPQWIAAEEVLRREKASQPPGPAFMQLERQPVYAQECRDLLARTTAPGTRDHGLSQGVSRREFTVPSTVDGFEIPILQFGNADDKGDPDLVVIYYHGGGLYVGEADSEEFTCRRIVKASPRVRVYSVGYRLMPKYPASTCVSDAVDAFNALRSDVRTIVVGSSSGGQLAATVAQGAPKGAIHGLLLRCPVTSDASEDKKYIPDWLRPFHTTRDPAFETYVFGKLDRPTPRDGLARLPLEASREELGGHPRTWIQLCTNDTLYSDGLCLGMALVEAGVEVGVDVQEGWPHTFFLKTPQLEAALDADEAMLGGLKWLLQ